MAALAAVCRELGEMRRRADELASRRDLLLGELRDAGVSGTELARITGLSSGRITQIVSRLTGGAASSSHN